VKRPWDRPRHTDVSSAANCGQRRVGGARWTLAKTSWSRSAGRARRHHQLSLARRPARETGVSRFGYLGTKDEEAGAGESRRDTEQPALAQREIAGGDSKVAACGLAGMEVWHMKRETKVGIVVTASFVCLVGGVLFVKYVQDRPTATPSPDRTPPAANSTATADRTNKPAQPPSPSPAATSQTNNHGGLPPLPGDLTEPCPPLPPLPPKSSSVTPAPAPVPSEPSLPGDNDDQQVVRSGSTNQPTSLQRSAPNSFPEMKPLPQV